MLGTFALSVGAAVSSFCYLHCALEIAQLILKVFEFAISGRNGVLGEMGTQSTVACFTMAHA